MQSCLSKQQIVSPGSLSSILQPLVPSTGGQCDSREEVVAGKPRQPRDVDTKVEDLQWEVC